jgi:GntR family L-lactate dehydrogenase operon transcriptional regulator
MLVREWNQEEHQRSLAEDFFQTLRGHSPEQLLDVLLARRAIERETSRLAALRGSEADIAAILAYGEILDNHTRGNVQVAVMDRTFHEAIANAAKNKVLAAALRLVRQNGAIRNLFISIRAREGYVLGGDHQAIAEAIARKDPHAAEEAMLRHIDNIIRDVQKALRSET